MKISKLKIVNFKGIANYEVELSQKMAFIGPNGTGKTSFLEALRWVLTGKEPNGEIIRKGATSSEVELVLDDGTDISRIKRIGAPSEFRVNGRKSTAKAITTQLESTSGVTEKGLEVLTSSEVVAELNSADLSTFIMSHIAEEMTADEVVDAMPEVSPDEKKGWDDKYASKIDLECQKTIRNMLPEEKFTMAEIDEFYDFCVDQRKSSKKNLEIYTLKTSTEPAKPTVSESEIDKRYEELATNETCKKVYEAKKREYDSAVSQKDMLQKRVESLEKDIADKDIATKPTEAEHEAIIDAINKASQARETAEKAMTLMQSTLEMQKRQLSQLDTSICPLSEKIICTCDKTKAKEDLEESIEATEAFIPEQQEQINRQKMLEAECNVKLDDWVKRNAEYNASKSLKKQLMEAKEQLGKIKLPEKPVEEKTLTSEEIENERKILRIQRDEIVAYAEYLKNVECKANAKFQVDVYEYLCSMFSQKGPVRQSLINKYIEPIEAVANEKAVELGMVIGLESDDGIKAKITLGDNPYTQAPEELSAGEKIRYIAVMMHVLNALTGFNILILDELSPLDNDAVKEMFNVLGTCDEYDHIIITAPEYSEIRDAAKENGFAIISELITDKDASEMMGFATIPEEF